MLRCIASGIHQSNFIIIEDSINYSGRSLWQSFIQQMGKCGQHEIHVLCYESPIEALVGNFSTDVQLHDCFSDPRGWNKCDGEDLNLLAAVEKAVDTSNGDIILAIDSLSPLFFTYGVAQCYRSLHLLVSKPLSPGVKLKQLICVVHEDFLPDRDATILRLHRLAKTYLKVESPLKGNYDYPTVRITHKKPGGKIIKKVEQFYFDGEGHVESIDLQPLPVIPEPSVDPVSTLEKLTTFKLGLREEEKKARSELVLPYIKTGEEGDRRGGQVFYQPDAGDDWDEEDPDDDLDI